MTAIITLACVCIVVLTSSLSVTTAEPSKGDGINYNVGKAYVEQAAKQSSKHVETNAMPIYNSQKTLCVGDKCPEYSESAQSMQADILSLVTRYVGVGYNLLKGNPEGEFTRGAIDPGILITKHIFEFSYDDDKQVYYRGSSRNLPDQVYFHEFSSYSMSNTLSAYSGQKSYQSQLSLSVEADANYAGYDFAVSTGMESARAGTEEQQRVNIDKQEIHASGRVRYQVENNDDPAYKVSTSFYNVIKNLPDEGWSETAYFNFVDDWGTHLLVQVDVGTRYIYRSYMSYAETYKYMKDKNEAAISASGSYGLFSSSFSVDLGIMNEQIDSSSQLEERTETFSMGTEDDPLPVHIVLEPITDALAPEYWNDLPNGDTYESLRIADKKEYIERALLEYPDYLQLSQLSDPQIIIPNAWPDGKYALLSTLNGCPSEWSEGWRYHDTEDDNSNNYWSADLPSRLRGDYNKNNLRQYYCVKGDSATDYGLDWPKGSYCIARYGGSCPTDFRSGSIYWDDEDDNNRNNVFGVLPDGTYNANTKIQYCCRNDERPSVSITLPTDQPFVLYRYGGTCQSVEGMSVLNEYLRFDNEDDNNKDSCSGSFPDNDSCSNNHVFRYCYYYKKTKSIFSWFPGRR